MCTVSVVPTATGFRVACNRDEQRARPVAEPPTVHHFGRTAGVWPGDPISGGTWIGVNDAGLAMAVLDRRPDRTTPGASARFESRDDRPPTASLQHRGVCDRRDRRPASESVRALHACHRPGTCRFFGDVLGAGAHVAGSDADEAADVHVLLAGRRGRRRTETWSVCAHGPGQHVSALRAAGVSSSQVAAQAGNQRTDVAARRCDGQPHSSRRRSSWNSRPLHPNFRVSPMAIQLIPLLLGTFVSEDLTCFTAGTSSHVASSRSLRCLRARAGSSSVTWGYG